MSKESTGREHQQRVTTQATGRSAKMHQLIGIGLLIVGVVMTFAGGSPASESAGLGPLLAVAGIVWYVVARFMAWWRYG